jgi:pilus assembly protein Flp/PilA
MPHSLQADFRAAIFYEDDAVRGESTLGDADNHGHPKASLVNPDPTFEGFRLKPLQTIVRIGAAYGTQAGNCGKETKMNTMLLKLHIAIQNLASREEGQDLVEYALITALLAFGWIAGVKAIATALNGAFSNISGTLGSYVS